MKLIVIGQSILWFRKVGKVLIPTDHFKRTWGFPWVQQSFRVTGRVITRGDLNRFRIAWEDDQRLLLEVWFLEDQQHWELGQDEVMIETLRVTFGRNVMVISPPVCRSRDFFEFPWIPLERDPIAAPTVKEINRRMGLISFPVTVWLRLVSGAPTAVPSDTQKLIITGSCLPDLNFLGDLPELRSLTVEYTAVEDWQALVGQTELEELILEGVQFDDSSLLAGLVHLKKLRLINCGLREVEGLAGKPDLQLCDLSFNQDIQSLAPLRGAAQMSALLINNTSVSRLDLSAWSNLLLLEMQGTTLTEVRNLAQCLELQIMDWTLSAVRNMSFHQELDWLMKHHQVIAIDRMDEAVEFDRHLLIFTEAVEDREID